MATQTKLSNPDDHMILDEPMSKAPLAGAVFQGDPVWADTVRWAASSASG